MNFTETQEMNRTNEEEIEKIYANEDILYDDVRRGTDDGDAKRLPCKGSDSVRNRMNRAVLVCLVLLCVLLLTVIIVLRVQLNAEAHQHQMDRESSAKEINQVQANNKIQLQNHENDRNQFQNEKTDLEEKRNQLQNEFTDLEKERQKLQDENNVLKKNETHLLSIIANLKNEITNQSKTNITIT